MTRRERVQFTIYQETTGLILRSGTTNNSSMINVRPGELLLMNHRPPEGRSERYYVQPDEPGSPILRPEIATPAAAIPLSEPLTIEAVVANSSVYVDDVLMGVTTVDGDVLIDFDTDGFFTIRIATPFPWLPLKHTIEVT